MSHKQNCLQTLRTETWQISQTRPTISSMLLRHHLLVHASLLATEQRTAMLTLKIKSLQPQCGLHLILALITSCCMQPDCGLASSGCMVPCQGSRLGSAALKSQRWQLTACRSGLRGATDEAADCWALSDGAVCLLPRMPASLPLPGLSVISPATRAAHTRPRESELMAAQLSECLGYLVRALLIALNRLDYPSQM